MRLQKNENQSTNPRDGSDSQAHFVVDTNASVLAEAQDP